MLEQLRQLKDTALAGLAQVDGSAALEAWRTEHLGKKSVITATLKGVGQLPPEDRPVVGKFANEVRLAFEAALAQAGERVLALEQERAAEAERVDVTLPGRPVMLGRLHPITQVLYDIYDSTCRPITLRGICGARSTRRARASCCGRTHRLARSAPCAGTALSQSA